MDPQTTDFISRHLRAKGWVLAPEKYEPNGRLITFHGRTLLVVRVDNDVWLNEVDDGQGWVKSVSRDFNDRCTFANGMKISFKNFNLQIFDLSVLNTTSTAFTVEVNPSSARLSVLSLCCANLSLNAHLEESLLTILRDVEKRIFDVRDLSRLNFDAGKTRDFSTIASVIVVKAPVTAELLEQVRPIFSACDSEGCPLYTACTVEVCLASQIDVDRFADWIMDSSRPMPFLRHITLTNCAEYVNLNALLDVMLNSPFVEKVAWGGKPFMSQSVEKAIADNGRCESEKSALKVQLLSHVTVSLNRRVNFQPLCVQRIPSSHETVVELVIAFGDHKFNVNKDCVKFSTLLTELKRDRSSTEELESAVVLLNEEIFHSIPFVGSNGVAERRFDAKDLQLCVQWLNEYASDAQHEKCVKCREEPFYFISRASVAFYQTRIVVEGNCRATLQRLLSVLAAAHFLGVLSLEAQLQSILLTPHLTPYYPLM